MEGILFNVFKTWLMLFSIAFSFLPIPLILKFRKQGTAEGFSSINFVLPLLMMSCWCRHGLMTNDAVNIYLNAFNLVIFSIYIAVFAYYQPIRKYLVGQIICLVVTVYILFQYVDGHPTEKQADVMAAVAAATQIGGLFGGIYDIVRAVSIKTTEYIPAEIQFGIFALTTQWTLFGVIIGNYPMAIANVAGLVVNVVTIALFWIYPPETWVVPILGTGGKKVHKKKE